MLQNNDKRNNHYHSLLKINIIEILILHLGNYFIALLKNKFRTKTKLQT